jgi:long-subunit acyl-CoA synthetase (AMP-forming)
MRLAELCSRLDTHHGEAIAHLKAATWRSIDYAELARDVAQAAERLRACGVERGVRIGLRATNGYEWIVYDLALLALGCVNVAFPEAFLRAAADELIEKYDLALLLLSERDRVERPISEFALFLEDKRIAPIRRPKRPPEPDPAAIPTWIFSSGTSGRLKCIEVRGDGVEHLIESFVAVIPFVPDDRVLVFLPLSNLQQRLMAFGALWYGRTIVLAEPASLFRALQGGHPTIVIAPPLFYETVENKYRALSAPVRAALGVANRALAAPVFPRSVRERALRGVHRRLYDSLGGRVRVLITGMAHTRRSTLEFFRAVGLPLFEAYGVTECGLVAVNSAAHNRLGSVGRPLDDGSVRIAADGEILVTREKLLSRGYLFEDAAESAGTFIAGDTVATGDVGHFDRDGYLYISGRKKEIIVTSGGYKVHPELLEAQIDQSPSVARSVVFGEEGMRSLCAVVSLRSDARPDAEAGVREWVGRVNAANPEPSHIGKVVLTREQFTADNGLLTRNLKIDRRAVLRQFVRAQPAQQAGRSVLEERA